MFHEFSAVCPAICNTTDSDLLCAMYFKSSGMNVLNKNKPRDMRMTLMKKPDLSMFAFAPYDCSDIHMRNGIAQCCVCVTTSFLI